MKTNLKYIQKNLLGVNKYIFPIVFIVVLFFFFFNKAKDIVNDVGDALGSAGSTLTKFDLERIKSVIDEAVQGYTSDNDQQKIINELAVLSLADYNKLSSFMGLMWYSYTFNDWGIPYASSKLSLTQVLNEELSNEFKDKLLSEAPHLTMIKAV